MAKDFAHNGPAITVVVIIASGLGVLMAYAIGRFWVTQSRGGADIEEGRSGEMKQVDHMREVRNRNRDTIAGTYGGRIGGPAPGYDNPNAWQGNPRSGVNSYAYEDTSAYEWAPGAKGGQQAHAQEAWDETGADGYPETGYGTPMYEERSSHSPFGPAKTPSKMSARASPLSPEMAREPVQNVEVHANEKQ